MSVAFRAVFYNALGDRDRDLQYLEEACEWKENIGVWIDVNPEFDSLRDDPRFQDLLGSLKFPSSN